MNTIIINDQNAIATSEIQWRFSRSRGPGGQNVNKVSSRVTLLFDLSKSVSLSEESKSIIRFHLERYMNKKDILMISVEQDRSQLKNRYIALKRFQELLAQALQPRKNRCPTHLPESADAERIARKRDRSRLKEFRRKSVQEADTQD